MKVERILIFGHSDAIHLAKIASEFAKNPATAVVDLSERTPDDAYALVDVYRVRDIPVIAVHPKLTPERLQDLTDGMAVSPADTVVMRLWSTQDFIHDRTDPGAMDMDDHIRFLGYQLYTVVHDAPEETVAQILLRGALL